MKPRPFDYARPDTVDEAVALLAEHGDEARDSRRRAVADGDDEPAARRSGDADRHRAASPSLAYIRDLGEKIEIGAAVTQNKLLAWPDLKAKLPLLAAALPYVGHFQTRNKGTVCGSIAHADPSSEIPLSLAILEGEVVLRSKRGERVLKAKDFQIDMLTTAREADELIVAVRFPAHGRGVAFREVARRHGDFAMVAVAATIDGKGNVRLGVGGMAATPVVRTIANGGAKGAVEKLAAELEGYEDLHASAELRSDILRNLAPLVIAEAQKCAA